MSKVGFQIDAYYIALLTNQINKQKFKPIRERAHSINLKTPLRK